MKNGPAGPFSYDWIIYKRQRSRVRFFRFSARQSPQSISTQLIGFFRQIASGIHRRRRPGGRNATDLGQIHLRHVFFLDLFRGECAEERVPITRDATIPVTSFIASTLHKVVIVGHGGGLK